MSILDSDPAYTDPDDELRVLLERQHLILEMEATQGWVLWRDFVAALASGYQSRLLRGRHADMLDYRYDAGVLEGIRMALGASETLAERIKSMRALLADQEENDVEALAS